MTESALYGKIAQEDVLRELTVTMFWDDETYPSTVGTGSGDYGIFEIAVDGKTFGRLIDLYDPKVTTAGEISLGTVQLAEGTHVLRATAIGHKEKSKVRHAGNRRELKTPRLPIIIGELSMTAQHSPVAACRNSATHRRGGTEIIENSLFVATHDFARPRE